MSSEKRARSNSTSYFNFNGLPAKWEFRKFPVTVLKGKKEGTVVYDLEAFFHEAEPITEEEFDKLKKP